MSRAQCIVIIIILILIAVIGELFVRKPIEQRPTTTTTQTIPAEEDKILGWLPKDVPKVFSEAIAQTPTITIEEYLLADGSTLKYRISGKKVMRWAPKKNIYVEETFGCATTVDCSNAWVVFQLYPEGTEAWVHAGMFPNYCQKEDGTFITDIHKPDANGTKWYNYTPLIYVTGKSSAVSIVGYRIQPPPPSNVQ